MSGAASYFNHVFCRLQKYLLLRKITHAPTLGERVYRGTNRESNVRLKLGRAMVIRGDSGQRSPQIAQIAVNNFRPGLQDWAYHTIWQLFGFGLAVSNWITGFVSLEDSCPQNWGFGKEPTVLIVVCLILFMAQSRMTS